MARMIPAADRVKKARALIEKAHNLPAPENQTFPDLSYVAEVKDLMQQARDLVKFIPYTPSASEELKAEVAAIFKETEETEKELLHR